MEQIIEKQTGKAFRLQKGQKLKVIDPQGRTGE